MKSYGKKFLKDKMGGVSQSMIETRDSILWDVLPASRLCRVKIQGSNTLVVAHFPASWDQIPSWMKPGNAIRITHMGGKRGRIEVVGCGQLIPTPVASIGLATWTDISFEETGSHILSVTTDFTTLGIIATDRFVIAGSTSNNATFTAVTVGAHDLVVAEAIVDEIAGDPVTITLLTGTLPTPAIGPDCILIGCNLIETAIPRMVVLVLAGTYRIGGVTYTLALPMQYGENYQLGDGGAMGEVVGAVAINSLPTEGFYRYDLISVGVDGVIDYTAGTPSADPGEPTLAAGHVQLVPYIFVPYGTTEICQGINIGGMFSTPAVASLGMVIADGDLDWDELSTAVTVTVYDQYGHAINGTGYGWYLMLEIIQGNGTVSSPEEGESTTKIGGHTGTGSSYVFTYIREHLNIAYPSWVTSTLYYVSDGVDNGGSGYVCLIEHTSGTFADDLAAGKWEWQEDESPTLQAKLEGMIINVTSYIILRDIDGDPM